MRRFLLSVRRLSWPAHTTLICGAFLLIGVAVVDDYGVGGDALVQRNRVARNLAFVTGAADRPGLAVEHDRYYGNAFELPLLLLERGVGLEDSRSIYLMRHLVTHAFFLVGGLCCSLLVYRLSHSRAVALFALLVFVLQPRLYAHSFFNSRDLPFLSMFMVTLYVTHRAFRKETVGAFVLCGVCIGILTNLRIMGAMLYPAVLALRGLDAVRTGWGGGRGYVLGTGAVFAGVGVCTLYALSPYLWTEPFEFVTAWQTLAHHPNLVGVLFQGQMERSSHLPPHYIPMWVAISTPLVTLASGVLGGFVVGVRSIVRLGEALGNTNLRFGLLLVGCLTLPVVAIITLGSHMYDDWRHVYFLHAPLCGLAGLGLQWAGGKSRRWRWGVYGLAGVGILMAGTEMVQLHPLQHVYFNRLVDRTTPEYLLTHYPMDLWQVSCREGLEFLRRRYPATMVYVHGRNRSAVGRAWSILPQADRAQLVLTSYKEAADFRIFCGERGTRGLLQRGKLPENVVYRREAYNNTLLMVTNQVTVPDRTWSIVRRVETTYQESTAGELVSEGTFDIYTYPGTRLLGYTRSGCTFRDTRPFFFIHVFPVDAREIPAGRRQYGFDSLDFGFDSRGKLVADQCWTTVELPDYEIARIHTGQYTEQGRLWEAELVGPIR